MCATDSYSSTPRINPPAGRRWNYTSFQIQTESLYEAQVYKCQYLNVTWCFIELFLLREVRTTSLLCVFPGRSNRREGNVGVMGGQ